MSPPNNDEKQPNWESLEVYEGAPLKELRPWQAKALSVFFGLVGLAIVFSCCGAALWFVLYRYGGLLSSSRLEFALNEEPWMAWTRFIVGGSVGVLFTLRWWCRIRQNEKNSVSRTS